MCRASPKVKNRGKEWGAEEMIGSVQPVSYSRAVIEVQPVSPVRGKETAFVPKENAYADDAFFWKGKSTRLLDILI